MEIRKIECPCCGGHLDIEDSLDTFFCKYCGSQLMIDGQDGATLNAKVKIKEFEHQEKMADKKYAHKKYMKAQENKQSWLAILFCVGLLILFWGGGFGGLELKHNRTIKSLESLYEEAEGYILAEDYDKALLAANKISLDGNFSSEEKKAWNEKKENLVRIIEEKQRSQILSKADNVAVRKSSTYTGMNHKDVRSELANYGFRNIEEVELEKKPGLFHSAGEVEHITVNGMSSFDDGTIFNINDKVTIFHYKD